MKQLICLYLVVGMALPVSPQTSIVAAKINGIRYANQFSGSDMGAQINAAFADFGAAPACGKVVVPPGSYALSTVVNVVSRLGCELIGTGRYSTKLTYAGSGTAVLFDNTAGAVSRLAVRDMTIDGTGSTGATGLKEIKGYYETFSDLEISNFATDVEINGGGAFGTNVIVFSNSNLLGATGTVLKLTGPNINAQQVYNLSFRDGQIGCSTTVGTTGLLIDTQSMGNMVDSPLVNGCGTGIHDSSLGGNAFLNNSLQGNTVGLLIDSSAHSDKIIAGYCSGNGTDITNNGIDTDILSSCSLSVHNAVHAPLDVTPYNGGAPEPSVIIGTSATNPRIDYYRSTGGGTFYVFHTLINAAGNFEVDRCDATATKGQEINCQPVLTISPLGVFTFSDNTGTSHANLSGAGALAASSFTDGFNTFSAAQINRAGAEVELQFAGGAGSKVGIGAGGSNPIILDANTGAVTAKSLGFNANVTWTSGAGAPAGGTCTTAKGGSLYSRTDGTTTTSLYVCDNATGVWTAK